jgi:hypothetical protein
MADGKVQLSEQEWQMKLSPQQFKVEKLFLDLSKYVCGETRVFSPAASLLFCHSCTCYSSSTNDELGSPSKWH